ncbi:hypothetical protein IGI96_003908 [Enterococcus sp. DIV0421]|nr:hypothetical protein [Enterococcus hirae]
MDLTTKYHELSDTDSKEITGGVIPLGVWLVGSFMVGYVIEGTNWKPK